MCHSSCGTCSGSSTLFNDCLTCSGSNIFFEKVCYCSSSWNNDCTSQTFVQQIFKSFHVFLILLFILVIILYCLKIKLPLSYRVLSGIQAMSILIYSPKLYLDFQDFFLLKTFNLLSGPYNLKYRLQQLSNTHAIQTYILLGAFILLLFLLYEPSNTFYKQKQSYFIYLKEGVFQYLQNFYYFGGKMMFFYIGSFISSTSTDMISIIHLGFFSLLILATFARLIIEYHKNALSQEIYPGPIYLYVMLSNIGFIGFSLVTSSQLLILIYCIPLGLLILISILNKQIQILQKKQLQFYGIQIIMTGLSICMIILGDTIKTYILLLTLVISVGIIIFQLSTTYYGGIKLQNQNDKKLSNRVAPLPSESQKNKNQILSNKTNKTARKQNQIKSKYF